MPNLDWKMENSAKNYLNTCLPDIGCAVGSRMREELDVVGIGVRRGEGQQLGPLFVQCGGLLFG